MPKRTGIPFSFGGVLTDISEFDKLYQLERINKIQRSAGVKAPDKHQNPRCSFFYGEGET